MERKVYVDPETLFFVAGEISQDVFKGDPEKGYKLLETVKEHFEELIEQCNQSFYNYAKKGRLTVATSHDIAYGVVLPLTREAINSNILMPEEKYKECLDSINENSQDIYDDEEELEELKKEPVKGTKVKMKVNTPSKETLRKAAIVIDNDKVENEQLSIDDCLTEENIKTNVKEFVKQKDNDSNRISIVDVFDFLEKLTSTTPIDIIKIYTDDEGEDDKDDK